MTASNIHSLPRIGIGEAMRLYGMTPRAIRFYDQKGLVQVRRDRLNHRYYDREARLQLGWIARLRRAGLSLPGIRQVVAAPDKARPAKALPILEARRAAVLAELEAVEAVIAELRPPRRKAG